MDLTEVLLNKYKTSHNKANLFSYIESYDMQLEGILQILNNLNLDQIF